MGVSFFWRTAQKIKIVVKNKHIISVLIFSSITGHGQSWACRRAESGPHMNTQTIFGSLLSHWPSLLYVLFVFLFQGVWGEEEDEQRWLHEQRILILPSKGIVLILLYTWLSTKPIYSLDSRVYLAFNMSVCLLYLSLYLPVYLSVCPYFNINISIDMFICLSIRYGCLVTLPVCVSVCLSFYIYVSLYLSVYLVVCLPCCATLSVCRSVCLSIYLSTYLSIYLHIPVFSW